MDADDAVLEHSRHFSLLTNILMLSVPRFLFKCGDVGSHYCPRRI